MILVFDALDYLKRIVDRHSQELRCYCATDISLFMTGKCWRAMLRFPVAAALITSFVYGKTMSISSALFGCAVPGSKKQEVV